jgi:uncharacterized protein
MKRTLLKILASACLVYIMVCSYIYIGQEKLLFANEPVAMGYSYTFKSDVADVWYDRPDGARLHGVRFNKGGAKGLMIYFHGNAGNNGHSEHFVEAYTQHGYEVLAYDYRGFGKSSGEMSEAAFYADALAVYDAEQKNFDPQHIMLVAWSFGSTQAAYVAANRDVARVVFFAPMASILDVGQRYYPFLPEFISNYPFRTDLLFDKIKAPVFIYHGSEDTIVPIESSLLLLNYFKASDSYMRVEGATHIDIPWRDEVWAELEAIL